MSDANDHCCASFAAFLLPNQRLIYPKFFTTASTHTSRACLFVRCYCLNRPMDYQYCTNLYIETMRDFLEFLSSVKKTVLLLHNNEFVPAMAAGNILQSLEF